VQTKILLEGLECYKDTQMKAYDSSLPLNWKILRLQWNSVQYTSLLVLVSWASSAIYSPATYRTWVYWA